MKVSINMAASIDGKIAQKARGPIKLGSAYDSRRMAEIRAEHDVVINGATTFQAHPFPLHISAKDLCKKRLRKGWPEQPVSAIVSSMLAIPRHTPWEKSKAERWVFCGAKASYKVQKELELAGVRVVRSKSLRPTPREILKAFQSAGLERVLLEGGGEFNASFLEKKLVDRIYLTLAPLLLGGAESPTFFEGRGLKHFQRMRLKQCRNRKGELYLIYERA